MSDQAPDTVRPESTLSEKVESLANSVDNLSAQVGICIALSEVTAVRVARISDEKEIREDEYRRLRRVVRERLNPLATNGNGHTYRKELESLTEAIEDTQNKVVAAVVQAQGIQLQKWQIALAIVTAIGAIVGAIYGGRASVPPTPQPMPYPVNIPTAGEHHP